MNRKRVFETVGYKKAVANPDKIHPIGGLLDDVATRFLNGELDKPAAMKQVGKIFDLYAQQGGTGPGDGGQAGFADEPDAAALESTRRELSGREPIRVGINPERARMALYGKTGEVRRAKAFDAVAARVELCRR